MYAALLLLTILIGLIAFKATSSLAVLEKVQTTGTIKPRFELIHTISSGWSSPVNKTLSYFFVVWPALLFGILIGGAVRTFISPPWLANLFSRGRFRSQLLAGLAGTPLMLCSCCVAPVFTSLDRKSTR